MAILLALVLLIGGSAWAQSRPASSPAISADQRKPKLAVAVSAQEPDAPSQENLEDLLMIELANQPFLQLVDRQAMHAVMKEHAIALSNLNDTKNALALGKFAGADFLLHVLAEKNKAAIRLVEVATGQVKLEDTLALANDMALSSAAIREKVLAALRPDSQAANRLTVGIAAFPNRSGTDRSDKLGVELQKALRSRLKDKAWAVVLERQYPTALLEEVDLARAGLVRGTAVEKLPPADLVIFGSMEDVKREYEPGKPWAVQLDLTLLLRGHSDQISQAFRSDLVETAAADIVRKIDNFRRRQPASQTRVPEKELWRRQAFYLMPPSVCAVGRSMPECRTERQKLDVLELIRAWENVLLLDPGDVEAMTNLGVCLFAISHYVPSNPHVSQAQKQLAAAQCMRGSQLIERALRAKPTRDQVHTFYMYADAVRWANPARAAQQCKYILDNPSQFDDWQIKQLRARVALETDGGVYAELDRAVLNAQKDPDAVFLALRNEFLDDSPVEPTAAFLAKYLDSPDDLVKFVFRTAMAELLRRRKKDPAALEYYDRAIEVMEPAYSRSTAGQRTVYVDAIYRRRLDTCLNLDRPEEAKRTALAGAKHFMEMGRFNFAVADLYHYCVTEALGNGQEKEALAICDAYLAAAKRYESEQNNYGPQIFGRRLELLARLAGTPLPGMGGLRLAKGTQANHLTASQMAATDGKLWLAWQQCNGCGPALMYRPDLDETRYLTNLPATICSVAAVKDAVCFGGVDGLYKLDTNGKLLKHYSRKDGTLPANYVLDLCEGGGKIYLCYQNGYDRYGVSVLDPATDGISMLAPSSREATREAEPVYDVYRVWWDVVNSRLYASYHLRFTSMADPTHEVGWMQNGKAWRRYSGSKAPRLIVSDGVEAVLVHIPDKKTDFYFLRAGTKVTAELPLPWLMGEPAWDDHRIWAPTFMGLYEIDRATGRATWLAHQDGNPFLSVLKHGNRLYVATGRGLYYREIPQDIVKTALKEANTDARDAATRRNASEDNRK